MSARRVVKSWTLMGVIAAVVLGALYGMAARAQDDGAAANPLASLPLRHIGPAYPSGRISDFAIYPGGTNRYLVATASGGLWRTPDNGTTWNPLFDDQGSYSLGVVELAPSDTDIIWVGTGENNAQRSVGFGDGVYKSVDGGKSWSNMGLSDSGHISQIWIHPDDADTVLVAAQGPLWSNGGDRGLYKTTDGGVNWTKLLDIDQYTGVNEFVVDPNDFDRIVASSYQRRRHVWSLINGGPGSGIHRTTDGGQTWSEVTSGLPTDNMGRIGLAGAPSAPDMIYAIIEASDEERGVYRSTNFGLTWEKRSGHATTSPQYYNEIVVDPVDSETLYSLDTFTAVSRDGGKSFENLNAGHRHVDDHALWIDPTNTAHLMIGGDGGIYESWDGGQDWRHVQNLSIVQFYRIQPDNDFPFYNVCGGTQDNNSLCGPSRTTTKHGIVNSDWHIILGGDGYKPQIDPNDPNIIYTQYQYGGLARYDRRTQERLYITPFPDSGEPTPKWNWNTPLLISPHNSTTIYYAAERIYQSDDRGDSWRVISPDLTRQLDRNALEVMDRVWSDNAIAKNDSTSFYGSIIALNESPVRAGLIYAGTDDGVISVTEDGGVTWRSERDFRGVPDMSLVEDIIASVHDENVAYAVFDNHKRGDHKPYVYKTTNKGQRWRSITGNLPGRGTAHTIAEDHVNPDLLFVGTEFGLFFTQDGGETWHELSAGFPTISVRDLEIQRRENDLVVGTFGRGVYILDDYRPLRTPVAEVAGKEASLFTLRDSWLYIEGDKWGGYGGPQAFNGADFWYADNPPYGAVFTYHLSEGLKTRAEKRRTAEVEKEKAGQDTPYPSWDILRAEDRELDPAIILTVRNAAGEVVRRVAGPTAKGLHRVAWDMRHERPDPASLSGDDSLFGGPPVGPLAKPGTYTVTLSKRIDGAMEEIAGPQSFVVKELRLSPEATEDREALLAFQEKTGELIRAVAGVTRYIAQMEQRLALIEVALDRTPAAGPSLYDDFRTVRARIDDIKITLNGDQTIASRNEPTAMSINERLNRVRRDSWYSQAPVTDSHGDAYDVAAREFSGVMDRLPQIVSELETLQATLDGLGAPWTPGVLPTWQPD